MAKSTHPKPRLGRGLSSLITISASPTSMAEHPRQPENKSAPDGAYIAEHPEAAPPAPVSQEISISDIGPNPYQPRRQFDQEELSRLAESIRRQGILQPLMVAPAGDPEAPKPFILVAGERRLRAARQAGLSSVPCVVRQAGREEMLEWALVENIHRSDLNPIERAEAYRQYMDRFKLSQMDVASRLGQPRSTIANHLRLLDLCDTAQRLIAEGLLSFGHAKVLAGLVGRPEIQTKLAEKTAAMGLSVRQLEEMLAAEKDTVGGDIAAKATKAPHAKQPFLRDLEEQLSAGLGTRVTILPGRAKNTGRIVIGYGSLDEFDRICSALGVHLDS